MADLDPKYLDPATNPMIAADPGGEAEPGDLEPDNLIPLPPPGGYGAEERSAESDAGGACVEERLEADLRAFLKDHDCLITDFGEYAQLSKSGELILGPGNHEGRPLDLRTAPADFVMRLWGSLRDRIAHEEGRE